MKNTLGFLFVGVDCYSLELESFQGGGIIPKGSKATLCAVHDSCRYSLVRGAGCVSPP